MCRTINALLCTKICDSCMKSARIGGNAYARLQNQIMITFKTHPHTPPLGCSFHVDELPACLHAAGWEILLRRIGTVPYGGGLSGKRQWYVWADLKSRFLLTE